MLQMWRQRSRYPRLPAEKLAGSRVPVEPRGRPESDQQPTDSGIAHVQHPSRVQRDQLIAAAVAIDSQIPPAALPPGGPELAVSAVAAIPTPHRRGPQGKE